MLRYGDRGGLLGGEPNGKLLDPGTGINAQVFQSMQDGLVLTDGLTGGR
jgi:hypothetical protein